MNFAKFFIIIFIFIYTTPQAHSQTQVWDKRVKNVCENSKRLIVLLIDPEQDPEISRLSKDPVLLKAYQNHINSFNSIVKSSLPKYWHLTPKVEYMNIVELAAVSEEMTGEEKGETLIMIFPDQESNFSLASREASNLDKIEEISNKNDLAANVFLMPLSYVTISSSSKRIFFSYTPTMSIARYSCVRWFFDRSDVIFAVQNIQEMLNAKRKDTDNYKKYIAYNEENNGKLASRLLLIPKEFTIDKNGKKTISDAEIKKEYPWNWKFATLSEINEAIDKKDANTAILYCSWMTTGIYFFAVDATDAKTILGYSTFYTKNYGIGSYVPKDEKHDLNIRRVKEIVTTASGKK